MGRGIGGVLAATVVAAVALGAGPESLVGQEPDRSGLPALVELPPELDRVLRDYETAWSARDADALAALFTEDGYALRPGRPPVHGHEALREVYAGSGGTLVLRAYAWAMDGTVAHVIGGFAAFASEPEVGKFVLALERGADGVWYIAADIDNGN